MRISNFRALKKEHARGIAVTHIVMTRLSNGSKLLELEDLQAGRVTAMEWRNFRPLLHYSKNEIMVSSNNLFLSTRFFE